MSTKHANVCLCGGPSSIADNHSHKKMYHLRSRQTIEDTYNSKAEHKNLFSSPRTFRNPSSSSSSPNVSKMDNNLNSEGMALTDAPPKIKIEDMVLDAINFRRNYQLRGQRRKRAPASFTFIKWFISKYYGEHEKANKTKPLRRVMLQMISTGIIVRTNSELRGICGSFTLPTGVKKLNPSKTSNKKLNPSKTSNKKLNPSKTSKSKLSKINNKMSTFRKCQRRKRIQKCEEPVPTFKITTSENVELSIETIITEALLAFEKFNLKNGKEYPMPYVAIINYFQTVHKIDQENMNTIAPFIKNCLELCVKRGTINKTCRAESYKLSDLHPQSQMAEKIKNALSTFTFDPLVLTRSSRYPHRLHNYSGMTLVSVLKYLETEYKMNESAAVLKSKVKKCLNALVKEGIVDQYREIDQVWTFTLKDPLDPVVVLPNMVHVKMEVEEAEVLQTMNSFEDIQIDIKDEEFGTTDD